LLHFELEALDAKEKRIVFGEQPTDVHELKLTESAFGWAVVFQARTQNLAQSCKWIWTWWIIV
jgi:hypothetical protein